MDVRVEFATNDQDEEKPLRFFMGDRQIEIEDILDRWPAADHAYFKVQCDDGGTYILRHDKDTDNWELVMYDSSEPTIIEPE